MIHLQEQIGLKDYNTFGIDVAAKYFFEVTSKQDIQAVLSHPVFHCDNFLVLGAGSNILLTQDFHGLVIKNSIKGITVIQETDNEVFVSVGAGENWHSFVCYALAQNWGGIENLSLIPGTMGAAPMQNIGAYGVEIKDVIESVTAIDITNGQEKIFSNHECQFGYRESIFKHSLKNKVIISSVTLRLTKHIHSINISYGGLRESPYVKDKESITIQDVSAAVIEIRRSKLPDPAKIGNAGSFFKNPVIALDTYHLLQEKYPSLPGFAVDGSSIKVPAAWLIEQCGWKGKVIGHVGVHQHQPLVLVNYGGGNGAEILALAKNIQASVYTTFGVKLQLEVNII